MNTLLLELNKRIESDEQQEPLNLSKDVVPSPTGFFNGAPLDSSVQEDKLGSVKEVIATSCQPTVCAKTLHKCPTCGKVLQSWSWLARHLKMHQPKPFQCPHCPKKFELDEQLKQHAQSHKVVFMCTICKVTFSTKNKFELHIPVAHPGTRPFKCNVCSKTFNRRGSLLTHKIRHSDTKFYHCKLCNTSFVGASDLAQHNNWHHIKIKRFACMFCALTFMTKFNLFSHIRSHIQEKPFSCSICKIEFVSQGNRKRHMKKVH